MKVIIIGYGKMGKEIEKVCQSRNIEILAVIDKEDSWPERIDDDMVALEFTEPVSAADNLKRCVDLHLPVVCGTTGWYLRLDEIKNYCIQHGGSIVYGSNFSPGVNALFAITQLAGKIFASLGNYHVKVEEIHHKTKKDTPSGTAITLAELLLSSFAELQGWSKEPSEKQLWIESFREEQVVGTHRLYFQSSFDEVRIEHKALRREGFAQGALDAALWLLKTKQTGFFHYPEIFEEIYSIKT